MRDIASKLLSLIDSGEAAALATVVRVKGSGPAPVGAKLLLCTDGSTVGTVGGGRIEQLVLELCAEALKTGKPQLVKRHLSHDLAMCCGGEVEVFIEPIEAQPRLLLFGAGHVAQATAECARRVGFSVTVVDDREELNTSARFADARRVLMAPAEAVRHGDLGFNAGIYVVITTHDHALDEEALRACVQLPHRYLGMIGSKRKVIRVFQRILQRAPETDLDDVRAPVGLNIGALTPAEIGLAITAELVAVRRGAPGKPMQLVEHVRARGSDQHVDTSSDAD